MEYIELGYIGLFIVCFLSATILPLSSEGVLLLFLSQGFDPLSCLIVASSSNTLGGTTNYLLGLIGNPTSINALFKRKKRLDYFQSHIQKYGASLALLSWVPFIGDPLTIALGFFRVPFVPVLILMFLAKTARYALIIYLWS